MKIPQMVLRELERLGAPWKLENGHGHQKLRVCGRLVGVLPHSSRDGSQVATRNLIASIRRTVRTQA